MKNKTIGIYLITEKETGRDVYVGQGIVYDRWERHRSKYPEERFDYRILLECSRTDLDYWEQHYIRVLKTHWTEGGENQDWGGQFWPRPEEPISPATRAKISATMKGRNISEETRAKLSAALKGKNKGKTHSEKTRAKMSSVKKGRAQGPMSEEQKAKLSAVMKGRVRVQSEEEKSARRGKPMSEEAKAKSSAALKGRVAPNKGKPMSEEQRAKLKGRAKSEEWKAKISAAAKARAALKQAAEWAEIVATEALLTTEIISTPE